MNRLIESDLQYDTLVDRVLWLGIDAELSVCTKFSKKNQEGNRDYYIREYQYQSQYNDMECSYTMKREMNTFIKLEYKQDKSYSLMITMQDMFAFRAMIKAMVKVLLDPKAYKVINRKLQLVGTYEPYEILTTGNRPLKMIPATMTTHQQEITKSIQIIFADGKYSNVDINNFMALYEFIEHFDFYTAFLNHSSFIASWKKENYNKCLISFMDEPSANAREKFGTEAAIVRDNSIASQGIVSPKRRLIPKQSNDLDSL